jgi:hypothetical protein
VLEHVAQEEARCFAGRLRDGRKERQSGDKMAVPVGSRNLQHFWVWEFVLIILKSEHQHTYLDIKPVPPFNALNTASQVVNFPLAFIILCMRAYLGQVRTTSIVRSELAVHSVAGWEASDSMDAASA